MSEIHKIFCTNCGEEIDVDIDEIDSDTVFCINCGAETDISDLRKQYNDDESEYCEEDCDETDLSYVSEDISDTETEFINETSLPTDSSAENQTEAPFMQLNNGENEEKTDNDTETASFKEHSAINLVKPQTSQKQSETPFDTISDDEKKSIDDTIKSKVKVWHDAIITTSATKSEFTDNFAHGMPDWDLTPPDMLVLRKAVKPSNK